MTTNSHAAPWTLRQFLADLFTKRTPRPAAVLTGREAVARALFGEAVHWSKLDMLEYDASPEWQAVWLAEADRRIASGPEVNLPDLLVLRHWGYTVAEWTTLPAIVKADKREGYFESRGLAS
ncbi:MAG TPA: hypothetical protein DEV93_03470 [Chloroflexi bacterium]|jgi:hypothetical protein|nr:hypothetical protein [Chloroflexota bacterium]